MRHRPNEIETKLDEIAKGEESTHKKQRTGLCVCAFLFTCLAELDIGIAELDKANDQQHNGHAGHAQEVRPVDAEEDRVAVQVEDGEIHEPDRHRNGPLEQFLHWVQLLHSEVFPLTTTLS